MPDPTAPERTPPDANYVVTVNANDLWVVLNQRKLHAHQEHGIWDDYNGEKSGTACRECAARDGLVAALDLARPMTPPDDPTVPVTADDTPEQRHPVSLMLADSVLRVVRPCTCDGDLIECSHEAARGQVEEENRQLRAERDAFSAAIEGLRRTAQVWIDIRPTKPTADNGGHVLAYAGQQILAALDTPGTATEVHAFKQDPAATQVSVCVCGKWRDHHVHGADPCGCDACRTPGDADA